MNYVYMIRCHDRSLYTGWTKDITKRFLLHCEKRGAKYTRSKKRLKLVYLRSFETEREARVEEARIKKLSKDEKEELIKKSPTGLNC